nr:MAG TPA: hypothetical protein [Caudoviricetes sp.]
MYGMNPKQYEKWMQEHWPEILKQRVEAGAEAIREGFKRLGEAAKEAAQILSESLNTWAEEIQVAAGFQETDNMLRKSNILPDGADKELLKHIGIRMDRYGWAKDGNNVDDSENVGHGMPDCCGGHCADHTNCLHGSSGEKSN